MMEVASFSDGWRLLQRHPYFRRKIHGREIAGHKFWIGCGGDHGSVVGGKRARREEYRQSFFCSFALERLTQFVVGSHASGYKQCRNVAGAGCGQSLANQILDQRSLERRNQVERWLI